MKSKVPLKYTPFINIITGPILYLALIPSRPLGRQARRKDIYFRSEHQIKIDPSYQSEAG